MNIPKRFIKAGNLGYPEEEIIEKQILKDGTFVKKVAQTVIVDHKTQGRRVESLTLDEFRKTKKNEPWPESATSRISLDHDAVRNLLNYLLVYKKFLTFLRPNRSKKSPPEARAARRGASKFAVRILTKRHCQ